MNSRRNYNWTRFTSAAPGNFGTIGLTNGGTLWAWGQNSSGQGGYATDWTMQTIPNGYSYRQISSGSSHMIGLRQDGTVTTWGLSTGTGTYGAIPDRSSPVSVVGGHSFASVLIGKQHSAGLKSDGTAWCWGYGANGQLGQGITIANQSSPVSVVGNHSFASVMLGAFYTVGLKADGTAWAWGYNGDGELGNRTINNASSPVSVIGNNSFIAIAPGASHCMAVKADGSYWGWGLNSAGQLGLSASSSSPVLVTTPGAYYFKPSSPSLSTSYTAPSASQVLASNLRSTDTPTGADYPFYEGSGVTLCIELMCI